MTSLQALLTALIRLLALFYAISALDSATGPFFMLIMQTASLGSDLDFQMPNPWLFFLPSVVFYVLLTVLLYVLAPRLARLFVDEKGSPSESDENPTVPLHETLLLCSGMLIIGWAFVRLTDLVYEYIVTIRNSEVEYTVADATMVSLFLTLVLLVAGVLLIAKFHRLGAWIDRRRNALPLAEAIVSSEIDKTDLDSNG